MSASYKMIGYIHEIPKVLSQTLTENEEQVSQIIATAKHRLINRIVLVGVGSSYTAALIALPLFRKHCGPATYLLTPSELQPYMPELVDKNTLVICISRSGERGGVVDALKDAAKLGAFSIAVTGSPDSLLAQNAPESLLTREGSEVTFAKTKSVATSAGLLMRLALAFALPEDASATERLQILRSSPALFEEAVNVTEPAVRNLIPQIQPLKAVMVGGTASNHGTALEFGIKLQEAANVPVVANDTDNLLHGPWGSVNPDWLTLLMVTLHDLQLSRKALELTSRLHGHRMIIRQLDLPTDGLAEYVITLPKSVDIFCAGLISLAPIQLLTYYWAIANGLNPDAPEGMQDMLAAMVPPGRNEPEFRGSRNS